MEELRKKDFSEEIDLKKFFLFLKKNLKNIAVLTLSGTILFGVYSFLIPDIYKSSAILKVNSDSSSNSSNLRAIDNFASVIGISNSSSSEVLKSDLAVETLKAKSFIKHISLKKNYFKEILASKSFDFKNNKIIYKNYVPNENDYLLAHDIYMKEMLNISIDKKNFVKISISHVSPFFAETFLKFIVEELNILIKEQDMRDSSRSLDYFQRILPDTKNIELKKSISDLMKTNLEIMTLTNIKDDYLLEYVDRPHVPFEKDSPKRIIIILIGFLTSFIFSLIFSFLISSFKEK